MIGYLGRGHYDSRETLLTELFSKDTLYLDTETVSKTDTTLLVLALAWSPEDAVFISADDENLGMIADDILCTPIVTHNVLFDAEVIKNRFGSYPRHIGDSMLLAQALGYPPALKNLSYTFNFNYTSVMSLLYEGGVKVKKKTLRDCDVGTMCRICAEHAIGCCKVWQGLQGQSDNKAYKLDYMLIPLLLRMREEGIRVDPTQVEEKGKELKGKLDFITQSCREIIGDQEFKPTSVKQVGIKISELGLFTGINVKSGWMKTSDEALHPYKEDYPFIKTLLKHRELSKLNSTYIKPLKGLDRIYPAYHIVSTGRFATGRETYPIQTVPPSLRNLLLPEEGEYWWNADAHQIEPRVIAYLSGDLQMQKDVNTGDIYLPIADRYGISRPVAKKLFMAVMWEGQEQALVEAAHQLGGELNINQAQQLKEQFLKDYHGYWSWRGERRKEASEKGYVTTYLGRVRTLESMAENEEDGYNPLKKVVSTIGQGTAADIMKLAMLRLERFNQKLTVHDELGLSTNEQLPDYILDDLVEFPVVWKIGTGENWMKASKEG